MGAKQIGVALGLVTLLAGAPQNSLAGRINTIEQAQQARVDKIMINNIAGVLSGDVRLYRDDMGSIHTEGRYSRMEKPQFYDQAKEMLDPDGDGRLNADAYKTILNQYCR